MTLEEAQANERLAWAALQHVEKTVLLPAQEAWRKAFYACEAAAKDAKIEAEVQRRLAAKEGK